jgi:hypothetical protein
MKNTLTVMGTPSNQRSLTMLSTNPSSFRHALACATCAAISILVGASASASAQQADPQSPPQPAAPSSGGFSATPLPPLPALPAGVSEVVLVREFRLASGYEHRFSKEKPTVTAGYIMVLRASSDLLASRQVAMPVLMVGATPVEPMNVGFASGTIVVVVPSAVKEDGSLALDLATSPVHFAAPVLPETIDAAFGAKQSALALRSGIAPPTAEALAAAKRAGGAVASVADREALDRVLGALVRTYAADESDIADALEGITDSTPRPVVR